ncbi:NUDIX hydrolase N-terminal domain-containing protein [Mycoplasma sp. P36-A1]|uniref:NUDIX hydrolase N-terminal domain-containing protein n=1 Tax=Mycoplasma sp. P36-A1 TaxID=3252900 RepID=UPI003C30763B
MEMIEYILRMQAIAKIGKTFSQDPYALENYDEIEKVSKQMLEDYQNINLDRDNYYVKDIYPTPNVSVRVIVEKEGKYLLVREIKEQKYSIPGGWCEVFKNLSINGIEEVLQESGYNVEVQDLLAIFNRSKVHATSVSEYAIYISAKIIDKVDNILIETDDVDFFKREQLPALSFKNDIKELDIVFDVYEGKRKPYFD